MRFVGDEVAAVAAESEERVEDALRLIEVEYEPLPFVVEMTRALDEGAPKVHEDWQLGRGAGNVRAGRRRGGLERGRRGN